MKTILCIVARTDSTRLPNKALLKILEDINLIDLLILRLKKEFNKEHIVLATTLSQKDDHLVEIAKKHEIRYYRGDKNNVLDRLINSSANFKECQNIVRITGDNPLTDPLILKKMIVSHEITKSDYTFTKSIPVGTRAEVLSLKFLNFLSKNILNKNNTEYMTYYFQKNTGHKKNEFKIDCNQIKSGDNLTIDTKEDLDFIKQIFYALNNKTFATLDEIIKIVNLKKIIKKESNISSRFINLDDFNLRNRFYG